VDVFCPPLEEVARSVGGGQLLLRNFRIFLKFTSLPTVDKLRGEQALPDGVEKSIMNDEL
jgi:hypothetical protein